MPQISVSKAKIMMNSPDHVSVSKAKAMMNSPDHVSVSKTKTTTHLAPHDQGHDINSFNNPSDSRNKTIMNLPGTTVTKVMI